MAVEQDRTKTRFLQTRPQDWVGPAAKQHKMEMLQSRAGDPSKLPKQVAQTALSSVVTV